ncbi:DUF4328 domain-containing protein [Streptomyces sp. NPDC002812]|uniref:DUF4328 domain-containing protein n=1 Tax=unclassified Streptomyces TaxID=2593676 RepID=UPI00202DEC47|nr:DUF4328 domain-containing protein [Streptomyces sp. G1]MCM1970081.1 DUF4328 domain-containing protein [Streptomyces sp. G1]
MSPTPLPRPVGELRSPEALARAVTVLLSLEAALALLASGTGFYARQLMEDLIADPGSVAEDSLDRVDSLQMTLASGRDLLGLVLLVVFLIWFHRVRLNGQAFRPDGFSQSAGWAIGGWFIPIANFVLPYRVARETWDASAQNAPDGSFRAVPGAVVTAWWVAYTFSWVLRIYERLQNQVETAEDFSDAFTLGAVADLTTAAAAVLAVLFVRKLTALQGVRAVQGPNAAA